MLVQSAPSVRFSPGNSKYTLEFDEVTSGMFYYQIWIDNMAFYSGRFIRIN
jgi:hypothetical protein